MSEEESLEERKVRILISYTDEINSTNWYSILERVDVTIGFSNPVLDACGYRALMVCQLAELYYGNLTIFLELPSEINRASTEYESFYKRVKVRFMLQRFASVGTERTGEPIVYGITIPENAPHKGFAVEFGKFILGLDGQEIFSSLHHPIISPAVTYNQDRVPDALKPLVKEEG